MPECNYSTKQRMAQNSVMREVLTDGPHTTLPETRGGSDSPPPCVSILPHHAIIPIDGYALLCVHAPRGLSNNNKVPQCVCYNRKGGNRGYLLP